MTVRPAPLLAGVLVSIGAAAILAATPPLVPPDTRTAMDSVVEKALATDGALDTLRGLTDTVGPRLAGSAGDRAAVKWAVSTLEAQGFVNVRAEPVEVPRWERGEETGAVVSPVAQPLVLTALGGSVPTPTGGLEAEVIEATSLEALDALGEKAKGKLVLLWKKMDRKRDGGGYGETVGLRVAGPSRAAKVGAVGVLLRSVGTSDARFPHTGVLRYDEAVPRIPAAALAIPDADLIHRLLADGRPVRVRFTLSCRTLPDADSANVVGEVRGREKPDEIVVVAGHLDSWDLGTGAVDDGAGVAISIEAARLIGAQPRRPRRTVRVVLYANEENGGRGAAAYVEAHRAELGRHVAALEADSGAGRPFAFGWNAGPSAEGVLKEIAASLARTGIEGIKAGGDGGADISALKPAGVPLFGLRQDASRYFDLHHTADDTFDKVDPAELRTAVAAAAGFVYAVADLPEPLERIADTKPERVRK